MSLYCIYFSPTGGTKKVVDALARAWQETPTVVDLSDGGLDFAGFSFGPQDVCLIGVPSFGGRVPEPALKRLSLMRAEGAVAVLVVSYGNRAYDDTLLELQDAAVSCGFRMAAAIAAVTEHSVMRQYGAGRPDAQDLSELKTFSQQLYHSVTAGRTVAALSLPGGRPFREYHGVPFHPKADRRCTSCGACAKLCPVGAIPKNTPSQTDTDLCISCMRCIPVCPVKARSLNRFVLLIAAKKMKKVFAGRKPNQLFLPDGPA